MLTIDLIAASLTAIKLPELYRVRKREKGFKDLSTHKKLTVLATPRDKSLPPSPSILSEQSTVRWQVAILLEHPQAIETTVA